MNRRTLFTTALAVGVAGIPGASAGRVATQTSPVLWAFAHPDDETIAAGLDIRKHLEAGADCWLLLATLGTKSGVRLQLNGTGINATWGLPHSPAAEGYAPLDEATFGAARLAETRGALAALASGTGRTVPVLEAGLTDGAVTKAVAMAAVRDAYARICPAGGPMRLKTHTDILVAGAPLEHPDHTAVAQAVRQLSVDDPATFGDVRFYVEPENWGAAAVTGRVPAVMHSLPVAGTYQAAAALAAAEAFRAWVPAAGRFAIGHQSVAPLFLASPENRYHA